MSNPNKILSDIVAFRTYSKYLPHLMRRESLEETINRTMTMHLTKFPKLSRDIVWAFKYVYDLKVMPSMRTLQFSGEAINKNNARLYNCSALNIDSARAFGEALFLLLSGVGVGYSVQNAHISKLPKVDKPSEKGIFVAHDSIQGWAQCIDVLFESYFFKRIRPVFDLTKIRHKGAYLSTTGAKAPGPEPLRVMLGKVEEILITAIGRQLKSIEVHDLVCIIADAVLAGGIRRAACISLFDKDDDLMLNCKSGTWWEKSPYRARANNSAILLRKDLREEEFIKVFKACKDSGAGEPGFSFTNNVDMSFNPCVSGDTLVLTDDGYKRIDSIVNKETNIWNGFEYSMVTPKITGTNQKMLRVHLSDGRILNSTLYHKWVLNDVKDRVETKKLKVGDKLIKHEYPVIEHGDDICEKEAYSQGFYSADGVKNRNLIWVYEPKFMCISRLKGIQKGNILSTYSGVKRINIKLDSIPKNKEFVPFSWNLKSRLNWLAGLFDGDGCELKEGGIQLASVDRNFLKELQDLLSICGVNSKVVSGEKEGFRKLPNGVLGESKEYYCNESYRICIGAIQSQKLKRLGMKCERLKLNKSPNRDASRFVYVTKIEKTETEKTVYCFSEPKKHLACFNGIVTGNCHEISLNSMQFCNLVSVNQTGIKTEKEFMKRIKASAIIATLQASYTEFPYLRPQWKEITEKEALIGVSFTGVADNSEFITKEILKLGAELVKEINIKTAKRIGINPAYRCTTLKPEGSSSTVIGSSSGIHARHGEYYIRRIRMNKDDSLAKYLTKIMPDLVEDDVMSKTGIVVSIPQKSPKGAIIRDNETAEQLFERAKMYNQHWIKNGHIKGDNYNNVSCTISVKDHEWDSLAKKMWKDRNNYTGISLLPFDGGNYQQAPFETITKDKYDEMCSILPDVDLTKVVEEKDYTDRSSIVACAGGVCELDI